MAVIVLYKDNLSPSISDTIRIDGVAVDLTGATPKLQMRAEGAATTTALKIDAAATIVNSPGVDGEVRYDPVAGDVDTAGDYLGWWNITLPTGKVQDTDAFQIQVREHGLSAPNLLYITREEMKSALSITSQTYADEEIDRACAAVSRSIDETVRSGGSHFYQATETRYYTPDDHNSWWYGGSYGREHRLEIDDLVSVSALTIDTAGDGSYSTTWVEGTDFFLDPANAAANRKPYEEIVVRVRGGRFFPRVQRAVKVVGVFGWPVVPPDVSQYASIFAAQEILRSRQAPFGILIAGMEAGATARISRFDPDFQRLLGSYVRPKLFL